MYIVKCIFIFHVSGFICQAFAYIEIKYIFSIRKPGYSHIFVINVDIIVYRIRIGFRFADRNNSLYINDSIRLPFAEPAYYPCISIQECTCISSPQFIDTDHKIDLSIFVMFQHMTDTDLAACSRISNKLILQKFIHAKPRPGKKSRIVQTRIIVHSLCSGISNKNCVIKITFIYFLIRIICCQRPHTRIKIIWRICFLFFVCFISGNSCFFPGIFVFFPISAGRRFL